MHTAKITRPQGMLRVMPDLSSPSTITALHRNAALVADATVTSDQKDEAQ